MVPLLTGKARKAAGLAYSDEKEKGFGEAIRTIRTSMTLSSLDSPHKVVLVTSSLGSEGKSTVAMNLALAFARGERVLLLEADMRSPCVARNMNLDPSRPGLSELLANQADIEDCVTPVEDYGLDVLATSSVPASMLHAASSVTASLVAALLVSINSATTP